MEGKGGEKKTPPKKNTGEKRGRGREGEGEGGGQRVTGEISLLGLPSLHPESIYGHLRHGSLTGDSRNGCGGRSEQPRCSYKGGGGEGEPGVRTGCRSCLPLPAPACPRLPPQTPRDLPPTPHSSPGHSTPPDRSQHPARASPGLHQTPRSSNQTVPGIYTERPPAPPRAPPRAPRSIPRIPPGHPAASLPSPRPPRSIPRIGPGTPQHPLGSP